MTKIVSVLLHFKPWPKIEVLKCKMHSIILWYIHGNPSFVAEVNSSLMKHKELSCYFHVLYYDHIPHTYNIKYYDVAIKYFCHFYLQALLYLFLGVKLA